MPKFNEEDFYGDEYEKIRPFDIEFDMWVDGMEQIAAEMELDEANLELQIAAQEQAERDLRENYQF